MKAIFLDAPLLKLRWRAACASRLALYQSWAFKGPTRLSVQAQAVADGATAAADVIEALVAVFGVILRPGGAR